MTQRRILQLAYDKAFELWEREKKEADYWDDLYHDFRERKARTELNEIGEMLYNEEHEK